MSSKKKNQPAPTTEDNQVIDWTILRFDLLSQNLYPVLAKFITDTPEPTAQEKVSIVKQIYLAMTRALDKRSRALTRQFFSAYTDSVVLDKMVDAISKLQDAIDAFRLSITQPELAANASAVTNFAAILAEIDKNLHSEEIKPEADQIPPVEKSKRERLIELLTEAKSDDDISDILLAYNGATLAVSERTKQVDNGISKICDLLGKTDHDWTNEMVLKEIYYILVSVLDWIVLDDMEHSNNDELSNPLTADQAAKMRLTVMEFIHEMDHFRDSNHSFAAASSFLNSMHHLAKKHKVVVVTGDAILTDLLDYARVPSEDRGSVREQIIKVLNREGKLNRTTKAAVTSKCLGFTTKFRATTIDSLVQRQCMRDSIQTYGSDTMKQCCAACFHLPTCQYCEYTLNARIAASRDNRNNYDVTVVPSDSNDTHTNSDFGTGRMAKASDERRRHYHTDARRDQIMELRDPDLLLNCFNCSDLPTCKAFAKRVEELKKDPFRPVSRGNSRVQDLLAMLEKTNVQSSVARGQQPEDSDCEEAGHRFLNRLFRRAER